MSNFQGDGYATISCNSCGTTLHLHLDTITQEFLQKIKELSDELARLKEHVQVMTDQVLSRLPETAIEPLKENQISIFETIIKKYIDTKIKQGVLRSRYSIYSSYWEQL